MEHLISMTDFVLEQNNILENILEEKLPIIKTASSLNKIIKYALFLKKPLKLGYLVPCDENDVLLKEPKLGKSYYGGLNENEVEWDYNEFEYNRYKEAKQRVLFEGFELVDNNDESWIFRLNGKFPYIIYKTTSVEFLTKLNQKIKLTETAKKEIGL